MQFTKATAHQSRLRLALIGPAGSGKTYSALNVAQHLGSKVAVIDTERGSASKYASLFGFDVLELTTFSPQTYVAAIQAADAAGYDVLVIDSLSHAWMGKGGALEMVDNAAKRSQSNNSFTAWRDVTPHHNAMIDAILACRAHVILTLRAKTEYVQEKDKDGKTVIRKVGLAPIQRDGLEYEADVVGDLDQSHTLVVTKSRCPELTDAVIPKPGKELADQLRAWLGQGEPRIVQSIQPPTQSPSPAPTPAVQTPNGHAPPDDDEPPSAHSDDPDTRLLDDLNAEQGVAPVVRFPYSGRGLKALYASAAVDFGWNGQNDVERALGGSMSAYAKAQHWDGQPDCLDRVWVELKRKAADETYTVAGRLTATE